MSEASEDREGTSAAPVPPDREPGEPNETSTGDDLDDEIKESEADSEEARVDAAPREIT
jgi:hypothetical protein